MKRVYTIRSITAFVSAAVFLVTEIIVLAAATVWAVSGFFHLGIATTVFLGVLAGLPSLYLGVMATKLAFEAETDPANQ